MKSVNPGEYLSRQLKNRVNTFIDFRYGLPTLEISKQFKNTNLHRMRIAIKKLKATLVLIEFLDPLNFNRKKYYNPINKIFKSIGIIRDIQLNSNYLIKNNLTGESLRQYQEFYFKNEKKALKDLKKSLKSFDEVEFKKSTEKVRELCCRFHKGYPLKKTRTFILSGVKDIEHLLLMPVFPATIHKIRKLVKTLYYNVIFLQKISNSEKYRPLKLKYKETSDLMGIYNDRVVLNNNINNFLNYNNLNKNIINKFINILKNNKHKNTLLLKKIFPLLKELILYTRTVLDG